MNTVQKETTVSTRSNILREAIKKTHLYYLGPATRERDVEQIWLEREGSQASRLEGPPPFEEPLKVLMFTVTVHVNFDLELADGKVTIGMCLDECCERVKLAAFNIHLEDVDERVT
jgi:hypothetical protein